MDKILWQQCFEKTEQNLSRAQSFPGKLDYGLPGNIAETTVPKLPGVRIDDQTVDPYNGLARARGK